MNKAVFLDRDGTIARDVHYCRRPEDFELLPGVPKAVKLLNDRGFKVIVVTNQSGIARGYFTEETLAAIHKKMKEELAEAGARVDGVYYCPHHPDDNCGCRKPRPKLVLQAARDFDIDLELSIVVGDLQMDVDLGKAVGCRTILVGGSSPTGGEGMKPDAVVADLAGATGTILKWANEIKDTDVSSRDEWSKSIKTNKG